jgi:hypothetical protein
MSLDLIIFIVVAGAATLFANYARLRRASRRRTDPAIDQRDVLLGALIVVTAVLTLALARGMSADFYGLVALAGSCAGVTSLSELVLQKRAIK